MSSAERETEFEFSLPRVVRDRQKQSQQELTADLQAALAREQALLREKHDLMLRQAMLTQEFEHRLVNGLQLIVSLLSLQSRAAPTPEASSQLLIAAGRVAALGRVHRRLHLLDHQDHVEFGRYLQTLCDDLSGLLSREGTGHAIVIEAANAEIPTVLAIPLGFLVNELITNSAKHANGHIVVRFEATAPAQYSLSVSDDGPGLPAGFLPANSKGLGMKIMLALTKQIGGTLHISSNDNGRGARFTVTF